MNILGKIKNFTVRFYRRILMVAILAVLIFILLASSVYNVKLEDGTFKEGDWTSAPYVASTYTGQAQISDSGITTNQNAEDLWNKMIEEGCNVEDYLDTPEELEKLMNAEIITQYPKIGKGDLDGIIQFERHKTDGTTEMLSYIDKDTFSSYVQGNDTKALDYFTLDDQGNVMVAYSNSTTETVTADEDININDYSSELRETDKQSDGTYKKETITVEAISINYKMAVQKYTMPFQYLWSLLVVGEDKNFVLELADLVENSEITISIYDNITTIEDVNTYKSFC